MDHKTLIALVTAITVVANVIFAFSGVTSSVSCTVTQLAANTVYAFTNP